MAGALALGHRHQLMVNGFKRDAGADLAMIANDDAAAAGKAAVCVDKHPFADGQLAWGDLNAGHDSHRVPHRCPRPAQQPGTPVNVEDRQGRPQAGKINQDRSFVPARE